MDVYIHTADGKFLSYPDQPRYLSAQETLERMRYKIVHVPAPAGVYIGGGKIVSVRAETGVYAAGQVDVAEIFE